MAMERLYALFPDVADAERAIGALIDHGIPQQNIGVAARRPAEEELSPVGAGLTRVTDSEDVAEGEPVVRYDARPGALPPAAVAGTITPTSPVDTSGNVAAVGKEGLTTTTPQDAAAGAAVGTGVGLVAGLLAAAAALAVPGFGLILGGGALAAALGATVATTAAGAVTGGVVGYLRDMGMPEQAAERYADRLREGDYLVTVLADTDEFDTLKRLLMKYNAFGVDLTANPAGQKALQAWGSNPALVEQLRQASAEPVVSPAGVTTPLAAPLAGAPPVEPVAATPVTPPPPTSVVGVSPAPEVTVVTENLDGTPRIPATDVDTRTGKPVD